MTELLTGNTPEKWKEIKTHPFYEPFRRALKKKGTELLSAPLPDLPYSLYHEFFEDGNRIRYQTPYFELVNGVTYLSVCVKLFGKKYLPALIDRLYRVLELRTWALPAHMQDGREEEYYYTFLDLFSTEIGATLTETDHLLGDVLPAPLRRRIREAVRKRIMVPYLTKYFWWMDGPNNWGAVCTRHVALCFMYFGTPEEVRRCLPDFNRTINLFLASYGKDVCCTEGFSYWVYGFGMFIEYADALRNYSKEFGKD
ncbi:MAG: hypothetical protein MJ078_08260, partial [Clostridia bacterium]|nr:hypothetical protein [Clostridia bacterium]